MMLSEHFTLDELTYSATANKRHIDNTPTQHDIDNLTILCRDVLEPARATYGRPLIITSGYRTLKLNRAVGGAHNSYHVMGMAADIHAANQQQAEDIARALMRQPRTDLVLIEHKQDAIWIHVQWSHNPRHRSNYNYIAGN